MSYIIEFFLRKVLIYIMKRKKEGGLFFILDLLLFSVCYDRIIEKIENRFSKAELRVKRIASKVSHILSHWMGFFLIEIQWSVRFSQRTASYTLYRWKIEEEIIDDSEDRCELKYEK